jgi:hypothetical protein
MKTGMQSQTIKPSDSNCRQRNAPRFLPFLLLGIRIPDFMMNLGILAIQFFGQPFSFQSVKKLASVARSSIHF